MGNEGASGGDTYAGEFREIARRIVLRMRERGVTDIEGINIETLNNAVEKVLLETTSEEIFLLDKDGKRRRKDALNFPSESRILLSLTHWKSGMDIYEKQRIVLHEYIGVLGFDDTNFKRTMKILSRTQLVSSLTIYSFSVDGPVAETLVEKIRWDGDEVSSVVKLDSPHLYAMVTSYFVKSRDSGKYLLHCERWLFTNSSFFGKMAASTRCRFYDGVTTMYEEYGIATIQLGASNTDQIWIKIFGAQGPGNFDYGLVTGESRGHSGSEITLRLGTK